MESNAPLLKPPFSASRAVMPFAFISIVLVSVAVALLVVTMQSFSLKMFLITLLMTAGLAGLVIFRFSSKFLIWMLLFGTSIHLTFHIIFKESGKFFSSMGFEIHLITIPLALLLIKFLWDVFNGTSTFSFRKKGLLPLMLYCTMCIVSISQAKIPIYTQFELFSLLQSVLLFLFLTESIKQKRDVFIIASALTASVALQGAISSLQFFTKSNLGLGIFGAASQTLTQIINASVLSRSSGTFGHANALAMYCDLLLPMILGLALTAKRARTRTLMFAAFALGFAGLLFTVSRGGIFASTLAISIMFLYWAKRRKHFFMGIVILLLIAGLVVSVVVLTDNPIAKRLSTTVDNSTIVRLPMTEVARNMISTHFLLGVGLNNYALSAPGYDYTISRISVTFPLPVHNFYLLVLAEIGIFGFAGLMLFLITVLWKAWTLRKNENEDIAVMSVGLLLGIIAFLLHTLVDFNYVSSNYPFWVVVGTIVALFRYTRNIYNN